MGENNKCTSYGERDTEENIIKDLSMFIEKLPYDFRDIDCLLLLKEYKKEIIRVKL